MLASLLADMARHTTAVLPRNEKYDYNNYSDELTFNLIGMYTGSGMIGAGSLLATLNVIQFTDSRFCSSLISA